MVLHIIAQCGKERMKKKLQVMEKHMNMNGVHIVKEVIKDIVEREQMIWKFM